MLTEENNQTAIMRRQSEYKPPRSLRHWLIGRPLQTADAPHQTIGKVIGLAVFASDALSSNAYATQEILGVLAVAGMLAFAYVFPIPIAIVALLAIVTISYQQTIYAYPGGGGAYIVSIDNLGATPAQIAGSALLTDYILTVAVSISACVAQIASASRRPDSLRVRSGGGGVIPIRLPRLRWVKEAGTAVAVPSLFCIVVMCIMMETALFRSLTGTLGVAVNPPEAHV